MKWDRLTFASRIMLPAYPLVYATIGAAFLAQAPSRTSTDAFDAAVALAPIPVWGVLFLAVAAAEAVAMLLVDRPRLYIGALVVGAGIAGFWAATITWSAWNSATVSWSTPPWIFLAAAAHAASARSISLDYIGGSDDLSGP